MDFERDPFPVITEEKLQHGAEIRRGIDVQGRLPAFHPDRGQQAEKAEDMVPVDVAQEDGIQLHHRDAEPDHLPLRPFPAVDKEQALTY